MAPRSQNIQSNQLTTVTNRPRMSRSTQTLKDRKEQLLRTAYLSAARGDASVVNYAARRVVESQGKLQ